MDPFTLFALANGAVAAVKKGCQLYKDIKSAAGDVKGVLKDLDEQFNNVHRDKPASPEAKRQLVEEKNRVIDLNKREGETSSVYTEIGEALGAYYDNYFKCVAVFEQEEIRSKTEVYTGEASLAKRALQRVLMQKQLEAMGVELRELMIYQSPPELGALFTEVEQMTRSMGVEQRVLVAKQMQKQSATDKRLRARMRQKKEELIVGVATVIVIFVMFGLFLWVAYDRQQKYPQYGNGLFPVNPDKKEEKYIYIGR